MKRYDQWDQWSPITDEDDGRFVLYDEAQAEIDDIRKAVRDCFGKSPMSCDGIIIVPVGKYNELARVLNKGE